MNDFIPYKEMDYIRDDPHMAQVLKSIGIININKMPGNSRSNDKDIAEKYEFWKPLLNWQLKVYNPDIIIFGNTFQYFKNDLFSNGITMNHIDGLDYCIDNKKLYLHGISSCTDNYRKKYLCTKYPGDSKKLVKYAKIVI